MNKINLKLVRPVGFEPNTTGKFFNNFNTQKQHRTHLERVACSVLILFLLSCQLILPPSSNAEYKFAENWTWQDTAWQCGAIAIKLVDWSQTRYISKHPYDYYETNPIMGRHPSTTEVDLYFAGSILLHTAIAAALPPKANILTIEINPRRIWQCVWIAGQIGVTAHNASIGIGLDF